MWGEAAPCSLGAGCVPSSISLEPGTRFAVSLHRGGSCPRCSAPCLGTVLGTEPLPPGPEGIHGRVSPVPVQWEAQVKLRFQLVFQAEVGRTLGELQAAVMLFYPGQRESSGHPQELLVTGPGLPRDQVSPSLGGSGRRCPGSAAPCLCHPSQPIQRPLHVPLLSPPSSFILPPSGFVIPSQSIHNPLPIHSQSPPSPFVTPPAPSPTPPSPFAVPSRRLPLPPCLKMELLPWPQLPQGRRGCSGSRSPPCPLWGSLGSLHPAAPGAALGLGAKLPVVPTLAVAAPWVTRSPQDHSGGSHECVPRDVSPTPWGFCVLCLGAEALSLQGHAVPGPGGLRSLGHPQRGAAPLLGFPDHPRRSGRYGRGDTWGQQHPCPRVLARAFGVLSGPREAVGTCRRPQPNALSSRGRSRCPPAPHGGAAAPVRLR